MKRVIATMLVMAFVVSLVSVSFGRTLEEEKAAVRAYLKVVDAKIVKFRATKQTAKMKQMQAEKQATLRRWENLKAQMEAAERPAPPPPPPAPTRVAPPAPAAQAGLFGMGLETAVEVGMVAGMMGLTGNIILPDPMGLGGMVGLSDKAVSFKLGTGYLQGNDINSKTWKAVPIIVDGVISLPADMMGGVETFVGGGINYVVYRTGQTGGSIGGQVYVGAQGDLGLGGKTYGELGYSIVRTGTSDKGAYSSKSVSVLVGQKIWL